ncbi:MAG: L-serine ammonia-lyase [Thermodesulfobacteriota bacterium]|nr:L-serine ammonia-lyase [Thermodesulfobacteriota bacterium]
MQSLRELYRIGMGPSSSHTMGPRYAALIWKECVQNAASHRVTLYGSLGATGKGHLTDKAIISVLAPLPVEIIWKGDVVLSQHPNGILFEALDYNETVIDNWTVFSVGGGALQEENQSFRLETAAGNDQTYDLNSTDQILKWSQNSGQPLWKYVDEREGEGIWDYLAEVWKTMQDAIDRGLICEEVLPGSLHLARKARRIYSQSENLSEKRTCLLAAYALAASEENASGGIVVTAPTCGSSGVLPAVLRYLQETMSIPESLILKAIATAGLIGNLAKTNASISGAEVGCQGEIGVACSMAAAAAARLLGGTPFQIEYAAEMGLEHHLGLTCDPVAGLVQIPCIERNVMAALRALGCAEYALFSDGRHHVTLDLVIQAMYETGRDLLPLYRETATGGLALHVGAIQDADKNG